MIKVTSLCTECAQPVTNPLCSKCFTNEIISWLRDKKISYPKIGSVMGDFQILLKEAQESPSDIDCISCNKTKVNFCTYCFLNKTRRIINKNISNKKIHEEFEEDFDIQILLVNQPK